jgi:hypothetical protein
MGYGPGVDQWHGWRRPPTITLAQPPPQLCHLGGAHLDVGSGPAAGLRCPSDVGAVRPVQDQVTRRWPPFSIDDEPVRMLHPGQVVGIVALEEAHRKSGAALGRP